jgi:hypothetical protein
MKKVISSDEILTTVTYDGVDHEVCATADAAFTEDSSTLTVNLDCFLRPVDLRHTERRVRPDWLPIPQTTHEHVDAFEAGEQAREVFHSWVRRVRHALEAHAEQVRESAPVTA